MRIDRYLIQKLGLSLAIIIILNMFYNYGVYSFYPSPEFEDFCSQELTQQNYETEDACSEVGGLWITSYSQTFGEYYRAAPIKTPEDVEFKPYCDPTESCRDAFETADSVYNRNVFITLVLLGAVAIGAAFATTGVSAVSMGLLYGGLVSFFIGTTRFWSDMDEYLRFIILGIVLVALIGIGYKKLNDKKEIRD